MGQEPFTQSSYEFRPEIANPSPLGSNDVSYVVPGQRANRTSGPPRGAGSDWTKGGAGTDNCFDPQGTVYVTCKTFNP